MRLPLSELIKLMILLSYIMEEKERMERVRELQALAPQHAASVQDGGHGLPAEDNDGGGLLLVHAPDDLD